MDTATRDDLGRTLQEIRDAGLWKHERELTSAQAAHVTTGNGAALNFCANNYLGLADHPQVVATASGALEEWGFGLASVRFICGTQVLHTELERRLADFLGLPAAILYSSCFDANGGIFETLFGPDDAIVSDELNHASLIDGIRLSRARRLRYRNADMADLAAQLEAATGARRIAKSPPLPAAGRAWLARQRSTIHGVLCGDRGAHRRSRAGCVASQRLAHIRGAGSPRHAAADGVDHPHRSAIKGAPTPVG